MEIYMRNIHRNANKYDIKTALSQLILHNPEYDGLFLRLQDGTPVPANTERKLNFEVYLPDGQNGVQNAGYGFLSLPNIRIGRKFLEIVERAAPVTVLGRKIFFSKSNGYVGDSTKLRVQQAPYQDPVVDQDRAIRRDKCKDGQYRVTKLEIGVWRDRPVARPDGIRRGVFSTEWKKGYIERGYALVGIDYDHRSIQVQLSNHHADDETHIIVLKTSIIRTLCVGRSFGQAFLCFDLFIPPQFEVQWNNRPTRLTGKGLKDNRNSRTRKSFLDDAHRIIAPFAYQFRISLHQPEDLEDFVRLCNIAGIQKLSEVDIDDAPQVFSRQNLDKVKRRLQKLSFPVRYQVLAIFYRGLVYPDKLLAGVLDEIEKLAARNPACVEDTLKQLLVRLQATHLSDEKLDILAEFRSIYAARVGGANLHNVHRPGTFNCRRIIVTPTRVLLEGPYPTQPNRIIREYVDHIDAFFALSFRDEDGSQLLSRLDLDNGSFLRGHVAPIFNRGFQLEFGALYLEALGYSNSSLGEHTFWFMEPFTHPTMGLVTASSIRRSIGAYSNHALISTPSKLGARQALAYTSTDIVVDINSDFIQVMDDLGLEAYPHSDGNGTISKELGDLIWNKLRERSHWRTNAVQPFAYQFRHLGDKGVVSVDENLTGITMFVRPTSRKFHPEDVPEITGIEIVESFTKPFKFYLNRQLIMILEDRGVSHDVFLELQRMAVANARLARRDIKQLILLIHARGLGGSFGLRSILETLSGHYGFSLSSTGRPLKDPFMDSVLDCAVGTVLRDIKYRARIPVPDSWKLVGVVDEGAAYRKRGLENVYCLGSGEIFACVQENNESQPKFLKGNCFISRSPTTHPGDVQRVWAIGEPPQDKICLFRNSRNVVVFPGQPEDERSLPSKLAGGDLDGDLYDICTYSQLLPVENLEPAEYPKAEIRTISEERLAQLRNPLTDEIDGEKVMPYVWDFVVEYMHSDLVGILSDKHLVRADQARNGTLEKGCLYLAELCSQAVDYPKNGIPVDRSWEPRALMSHYKPDWKKGEDLCTRETDFYRSTKAIGILYRDLEFAPLVVEADRNGFLSRNSSPIIAAIGPDIKHAFPEGVQGVLQDQLQGLFERYADELRYICVTHTLSTVPGDQLTEQEVVVGTINKESSAHKGWRWECLDRAIRHTDHLVRIVRDTMMPDNKSIEGIRSGLAFAWKAYEFAMERRAAHPMAIGKDTLASSFDPGFGLYSFGLVALGMVVDNLKKLGVIPVE